LTQKARVRGLLALTNPSSCKKRIEFVNGDSNVAIEIRR
jgi:hypothetical protein